MEQRRQMRREYSRDEGLKSGRRGKGSTTETRDEKKEGEGDELQ